MSGAIINYMISYDAISALPFNDKLLAFVKSNRNFVAWSKPYEGVYFVKTDAPMVEVVGTFREFFGNKTNHFIQIVTPQFLSGIAPPEFWSWIHVNDAPQLLGWAGKS